MLQVSGLYIYPIKSLGGISMPSVKLTDRGFEHDRRWMLIDSNNRFISQREIATLALLQVTIVEEGLQVFHKTNPADFLIIPFEPASGERATVKIWDNACTAQLVSDAADKWFSAVLNMPCRLVYMRDDSIVKVEEKYALADDLTSFSDGFPILSIGEASLQDLNSRIPEELAMNRFRGNLIFTGGKAFEEDSMKTFVINGATFHGISPCARCVVTTIDQETLDKGKEPLKILASYRRLNTKVCFGENVIADSEGTIHVGDEIVVTERKESKFANS